MQNYLNQLLSDIADIGSTFERKPAPKSMEDIMEFIMEDLQRFNSTGFPKSLGDFLNLDKIRFPDADKLSEEQCESVVNALIETYVNHGVVILLPPEAPPRTRYRAALKALDEQVLAPSFGVFHIQNCTEPFQGYCPYGLKHCVCATYWRRRIIALLITEDRPEPWIMTASAMLKLHSMIKGRLRNLDRDPTPNIAIVLDIFGKLNGAWEFLNEKGGILWYNPDEDQIPSHHGRTLLEWTGHPVSNFPDYHQLEPDEVTLLSAAMLRLVGNVSILPTALAMEPEKLYKTLVQHISCELRQGEFDDEPALLCPPEQPHIYHLIPSGEEYWINIQKESGKFY